MPDNIGYVKDYLEEYEKQATKLRKKKISEQVKRNLGLVKTKPLAQSFYGFMNSNIGFRPKGKGKRK